MFGKFVSALYQNKKTRVYISTLILKNETTSKTHSNSRSITLHLKLNVRSLENCD